MKGAGGTEGGVLRFFVGLLMFFSGLYIFLNAVQVTNTFHLGYSLFSVGNATVTSGLILIPFMLGVGMIFFNARNYLGWLLAAVSLLCLLLGVLASIQFRLRPMSAFEFLLVISLIAGGLGIFLGSLRSSSRP